MRISVEELLGVQNLARREAVWPWKKLLAELRGAASVVVGHHDREEENAKIWAYLRTAIQNAEQYDREHP